MDQHVKPLARELSLDARDDQSTLATLVHGLLDAHSQQAQLGAMYVAGQSLTEHKAAFRRLKGHLAEALEEFQALDALYGGSFAGYLDSMYSEANDGDDAMSALSFAYMREHDAIQPPGGMTLLVGRMLRAVQACRSEVASPGKGKRKPATSQYIRGIQMLARSFRQAMPGKPVSAEPETLFFRYVTYWFEYVVGAKVSSPRRHIQKALALDAQV